MNQMKNCIVCFLCLAPLACTSVSRVPAEGRLGGQKVQTTVDSELAKYYLENHLPGHRTNRKLHLAIDQILKDQENPQMDHEYLRCLSQTVSPDLATLFLARRILEDSRNSRMQMTFDDEALQLRENPQGIGFRLAPESSAFVFLFAPGWLYRSDPETGADFAKPRKVLAGLGMAADLIETDENGTVERNASLIAKEIVRSSRADKQIVLVSASKAGPEVALALGALLEPSQSRRVRAWINLGGILRGTPLADDALRWPKAWFVRLLFLLQGRDVASIESMSTRRSRERFERLRIPEHILVVNYIAIPLSGHVTKKAWDGYAAMRRLGPNDGLTFLVDELVPGGVTIVELGVDHYYLHPYIDLKTAALARVVMKALLSSHPQKGRDGGH